MKNDDLLKDSVQLTGLGMCGSRIALEFQKLGYRTTYYNSDIVDVRGSGINEKDLLLVSGTGSGGSPLKGREILDDHMTEFKKFLLSKMEEGKMQIFLAGLGGGTGGSSIIPAVEIARESGHRVGVLVTLPPKMLGMLAMDNAMKTLKQLKECGANMFVLADNEYLINKVGLSEDWWKKINEYIVIRLVSVLGLLREGKISQTGIGSIDKAEILRIIQYGNGLTDIRDMYFTAKEVDSLSEEDLKAKLFNSCFIEGFNYKDTLAYLVSIDLPTTGVFTKFSSKVFDITKQTCGSAISRLGMFVDPLLNNAIRVTMVNSGLKLPRVLKSKINNLKRDSVRHHIKKTKEDSFDFSEVDDISLDEDFEI